MRTKPVIPESASGGYPESRENNSLLDTPSTSLRVVSLSNHGSRPPEADSSGMTYGAVGRLSRIRRHRAQSMEHGAEGNAAGSRQEELGTKD